MRDEENGGYMRGEPVYHSCSFKDLLVGEEFYLTFDRYTIDVFWRGKTGESEHTQEEVSFPGLQVFALNR